MRQRCFLFLLLLVAQRLHAQTVVIAAVKQNVCYIGIENPVEVAATGCPEGMLSLSVDNGSIHNSGSGQWLYSPDRPGKAELKLWCRKGGGTVLLGSQQLRIKELPTPLATMAGVYEGTIAAGTLRSQPGIMASLPDTDLDFPVVVESYRVYLHKKNGTTDSAYVQRPYFINESRQIIENASPGDSLTVTNITAVAPNGHLRRLNNITLQVR